MCTSSVRKAKSILRWRIGSGIRTRDLSLVGQNRRRSTGLQFLYHRTHSLRTRVILMSTYWNGWFGYVIFSLSALHRIYQDFLFFLSISFLFAGHSLLTSGSRNEGFLLWVSNFFLFFPLYHRLGRILLPFSFFVLVDARGHMSLFLFASSFWFKWL